MMIMPQIPTILIMNTIFLMIEVTMEFVNVELPEEKNLKPNSSTLVDMLVFFQFYKDLRLSF